MFAFDNTWFRELPGTYVPWTPRKPTAPAIVVFNEDLASELGLDPSALREVAPRLLSGAELPEGAQPLAQAYAGHQFGGLSPQLGDGRAVLFGELIDRQGRRRDLQLKGSGRTPFSRGGDGLAALAPMLREYLIGEALHALGVPTTRALAVVATGDPVYRERPLPGAVLSRIAASHLRVGTLEFFAIRGDTGTLSRLVDHALARHHPDAPSDRPALALFRAVMDAQARLIARFMGVGFIHGVLNTDNVTLSGEAIDFGPCAFLDAHDPNTVFSSIDRGGRYAYGRQPEITGWNLARLASALLPLIHPDPDRAISEAQAELDTWADIWRAAHHAEFSRKLGLEGAHADDATLIADIQTWLTARRPDHTLFFRALADAARGLPTPLIAADAPWLPRWRDRLGPDPGGRAQAMDAVNPRYIPRNHRVEEALDAATAGDLGPFEQLLKVVRKPFDQRAEDEAYAEPAPEAFSQGYRTFCGT